MHTLITSGGIIGNVMGYFANLPEAVVLNSILGAAIYIIINKNMSAFKQVLFFSISFMLGTTDMHHIIAKILSKCLSLIGVEIIVTPSIGALITASGGISLLLVLSSVVEALLTIRGGGRPIKSMPEDTQK